MRVLSMIYITALMQEAAIGLPPFVPVTVIYGTFDSAINKVRAVNVLLSITCLPFLYNIP